MTEQNGVLPELMTARDVAEYLKVSVSHVHELVGTGRLSCIRLSPRNIRFRAEHVLALLDESSGQKPLKNGRKSVDKVSNRRIPSPRVEGKVDEAADLRKEIRNLCQ